MKILSNTEDESMICVLPNGVTVEITMVSLSGNNVASAQNVNDVLDVVKSLPASMLSDKQSGIF